MSVRITPARSKCTPTWALWNAPGASPGWTPSTTTDARIQAGRLLLAGEWIGARLKTTAGPDTEPWGLHLTGGWSLGPRSQALVRWDRYDDGPGSGSDHVLLGYNLWPTSPTEVQVNYVIPVDESASNHRLLVNFQVGF